MKKKITEQAWFPYTVAACIAVVLYAVLAHLGTITEGIGTFLGYFKVIIIGVILAYIVNPLAKFLDAKLLYRVRNNKLEWTLSVAAAVVLILLLVTFLLGTLIPQLIDSVTMLVNNLDNYAESLKVLIEKWGLSNTIDMDRLMSSSDSLVKRLSSYLTQNANDILNAGVQTGKGIASTVIACILSVYVLLNKDSLKNGVLRLMHAVFPDKSLNRVLRFASRCDTILVQYIVYALIDALIIGVINAIFMLITGMQYMGIISMIVAATNLVPTFGPIIGGSIGALILLLVKPIHALIFIIFTFVLQFVDGYIIKPKLFGNSLGVSGLLILMSVIVFGSMFGIVGMLISIPIAAILDFVYNEALMPILEKKAAARRQNGNA